MNSRMGQHPVHDLKSGYGLHLGRQQDVLLRAMEMAKNMRAVLKEGPYRETLAKPKNSLIPFQVKLILSVFCSLSSFVGLIVAPSQGGNHHEF